MIRILRAGPLASAIALAFACLALAQVPSKPIVPKPPPSDDNRPPAIEGGVPTPAGKLVDPTNPSPRMQAALGAGKTGSKGAAAGTRVSALALRGRVIAKDKPPAALLEVEGKLYAVAKGSVIPGAGNTLLRVVELNSTEVRIEVGPQKEIIILR